MADWNQIFSGDFSELPDIASMVRRRRDEAFVGGATTSGNIGAFEVPLGGHVKRRSDGSGEIVPDEDLAMPMLHAMGGLGGEVCKFDRDFGDDRVYAKYTAGAHDVDPVSASQDPAYHDALSFLMGDWPNQ